MMTIAVQARRTPLVFATAAITFVLGAIFLSLELSEFSGMIAQGAGPRGAPFCPRSSRWSARTDCM